MKGDKEMKAYDLLAKASCNLRDYAGEKYKVTKGAVIDKVGKEYSEFKINSEGGICVDEYLRGYISEWTEIQKIQQPIPFMEAVEAYSEGKTIRCEINGGYKGFSPCGLKHANATFLANDILEGLWFVEDSNE